MEIRFSFSSYPHFNKMIATKFCKVQNLWQSDDQLLD